MTRLLFGNDNAASIETFKYFVKFSITPKSVDAFNGSVGMLGSYPGGQRLARDGKTVIEDVNEYGQEWMVRPTDLILFHDVKSADLPMKCEMPNLAAKKEARRRLGESALSEEQAAIACARVNEADRDACIFDVMATNDQSMAGSY